MRLGRCLKPGSLVALSGELGTGKTQFIKGLAEGLGVDERYQVSSPSFVLINEYPGRVPLYHIDLYRLSERRDLEELGLEEYFYGNGVAAVEWAEKAIGLVPPQHIWVDMEWSGPRSRRLTVRAVGRSYAQILETLRQALEGAPA
jgi:tRNA threonylcarbamoyladenosine biosynthesis protein TsaE